MLPIREALSRRSTTGGADLTISRESMDGARAKVTHREESFDAAISTATQYVSLANAGAMVALLSFIGATGKEITNVAIMAIPFVVFTIGIAASAYGIYQNAHLKKANLAESITSLSTAYHQSNISLFNDTANGAETYLSEIERSSFVAFISLLGGILLSAALFPLLSWKSEAPQQPAGAAPIYISASVVCSAYSGGLVQEASRSSSDRSLAASCASTYPTTTTEK